MSNAGNVAGGHKANLNNPSTRPVIHAIPHIFQLVPPSFTWLISKTETSDESKQHSKEVLDQEYNGGDTGKTDSGDKNPQNVAGGLKASVYDSITGLLVFVAKTLSRQYD